MDEDAYAYSTIHVQAVPVVALQAAQALEPAAQIALQLLAPGAKIVLVGDPKQLPATVISKAAEAGKLTQSLFERMQQVRRASKPVSQLAVRCCSTKLRDTKGFRIALFVRPNAGQGICASLYCSRASGRLGYTAAAV